MTRPDITYAVSNVAKFYANPAKEPRLQSSVSCAIWLEQCTLMGPLDKKNELKSCVGFSDADWAGDLDDRKSTSGYIFQLSGAAISWRSEKEACVALSTVETEYIALANAAQEAVWVRQLLTEATQKKQQGSMKTTNQRFA